MYKLESLIALIVCRIGTDEVEQGLGMKTLVKHMGEQSQ